MTENENKMTKYGLEQIQNKIKKLQEERPIAIKRLRDAAALGDRSENAEYSASKRDLHHLESRLRFFRKQEQYAEVVLPPDDDKAGIGKTVTIKFIEDGEKETYRIVGKQEAELSSLSDNKLFYASPLGRAITGKRANDKAKVKAPETSYEIKILNVETE